MRNLFYGTEWTENQREMESFIMKKEVLAVVSLLAIMFSASSHAQSPAGVIQLGETRQMLLATLQSGQDTSGEPISSQLFLTSPSGNFAAYLVRQESPAMKKSGGHDSCYIQVQGNGNPSTSFNTGSSAATTSGTSQFGCVSITSSDTCSLLFSDSGLVIFGGTQPSWGAGTEGGHVKAMALLDSGDFEISDQSGKISWKASEADSQSCGRSNLGEPTDQNTDASQLSNGCQQQLQQQQGMYYPQQQQQQGLNQPLSGSYQPFSNGFNQPSGASEQQGFGDNNVPFENNVSKRILNLGFVLASFIANLMFLL